MKRREFCQSLAIAPALVVASDLTKEEKPTISKWREIKKPIVFFNKGLDVCVIVANDIVANNISKYPRDNLIIFIDYKTYDIVEGFVKNEPNFQSWIARDKDGNCSYWMNECDSFRNKLITLHPEINERDLINALYVFEAQLEQVR